MSVGLDRSFQQPCLDKGLQALCCRPTEALPFSPFGLVPSSLIFLWLQRHLPTPSESLLGPHPALPREKVLSFRVML